MFSKYHFLPKGTKGAKGKNTVLEYYLPNQSSPALPPAIRALKAESGNVGTEDR